MRKDIDLEDGNKIIINISPGYCTNVINIIKGYFDYNNLTKEINFSIWDDISISAYSSHNNEFDTLEFEFDINDPIYFCLNRLLANNKELIIDDDDTYASFKKYMIIKREDKSIKILFINKKDKYYGIFIKNIGPDPRSKIEDFNIKIRLIKFFRDMERVLLEETHQITFDEYIELLRLNSLDKEENHSKILRK